MTAFAAWRTLDDDVATDQKGSVFAVQHGLTAARHDGAVHEAEIGQKRGFELIKIGRFGRPV